MSRHPSSSSMDEFVSGSSSPASSFYGDTFTGFGASNHMPGHQMDWMRSSSPAMGSGMVPRSSGFQNLESLVQNLEKENAALRAERDAIKAAYQELVNAVPALLTTTSNPFGLPVPTTEQAPGGLNLPTSVFPQLEKNDYPLVQFWRQADYFTRDGVSNNNGPNPRGGTLAAQGINVTMGYVETQDGIAVDGFRRTAIGKVAAQIWHGFLAMGIAPAKWGNASQTVVTLYENEMCRKFPELRYCADNWKARQIATANYPSWWNNHGNKDDVNIASKKKGSGIRRTRSPPALEARKKVKLDDTALIPLNPLWEPNQSATIPVSSGLVTAVAGDPSATSMSAIPEPQATPDPNANPDPPEPRRPSSVDPPIEADPVVAAAARANLIQSAFPAQLPAPPAPPAPPANSTEADKKDSKMTATNSLTPRNLCAIDWIKQHNGTRLDFGVYWDSIKKTQTGKAWNKLSAERKAQAAASTAQALASEPNGARGSGSPAA
ncbi:hypothetical protein B0H19DRAFT_1257977 [Mycena capillaripes]|nr:hypothetical protein B0H19DRAFT_1257977 [Mycena capillaripes]